MSTNLLPYKYLINLKQSLTIVVKTTQSRPWPARVGRISLWDNRCERFNCVLTWLKSLQIFTQMAQDLDIQLRPDNSPKSLFSFIYQTYLMLVYQWSSFKPKSGQKCGKVDKNLSEHGTQDHIKSIDVWIFPTWLPNDFWKTWLKTAL